MNSDIFRTVADAIAEFKEIPAESVAAEQRLARDLSFSSFEAITLAGEIETQLGTRISQRDFGNIVTVGDLVNALEKSE